MSRSGARWSVEIAGATVDAAQYRAELNAPTARSAPCG